MSFHGTDLEGPTPLARPLRARKHQQTTVTAVESTSYTPITLKTKSDPVMLLKELMIDWVERSLAWRRQMCPFINVSNTLILILIALLWFALGRDVVNRQGDNSAALQLVNAKSTAVFERVVHMQREIKQEFEAMRRDIASINDEMRTLKNQIGFLSMKNDETNARVSAVVREHEAMSANQRKWMQKMEAANAQLQRKAEQTMLFVASLNASTTESLSGDKKCGVSLDMFGLPTREPKRLNLASLQHGARVVTEMTTTGVTQSLSTLWRMDFTSYFLGTRDSYNFVIMDRELPTVGDAFCFWGSRGTLTIELFANATLDSVRYGHVDWVQLAPRSAPKTYEVYGCTPSDSRCIAPSLLGNCEYVDGKDSRPIQTCHFVKSSSSVPMRRVQFRVTSNHGGDYTCLYQVNVYGKIVPNAKESGKSD